MLHTTLWSLLTAGFTAVFAACSSVGAAPLGAGCQEKADCSTGLCLTEKMSGAATGFTGGYCTLPCGDGCPNGAQCVALGDDDYCLGACAGNDACREGYVCNSTLKVCLPHCANGYSCGAALQCDDASGECRAAGSGAANGQKPAALGGACTQNEECQSLLCIAANNDAGAAGWTGGYCSQLCILRSPACPEGAACLDLAGDGYCLLSCGPETDCREGYVCHPEALVCLPDCRNGFDCGTRLECSAAGYCQAPGAADGGLASPGSAALGEPCSANQDCLSGYCLAERKTSAGVAWIDGLCSQTCGTCPADYDCAAFEDSSVCLPQCETSDGCRSGYICQPLVLLCYPDCLTGFVCGTGWSCMPGGFCVKDSGDGGLP